MLTLPSTRVHRTNFKAAALKAPAFTRSYVHFDDRFRASSTKHASIERPLKVKPGQK